MDMAHPSKSGARQPFMRMNSPAVRRPKLPNVVMVHADPPHAHLARDCGGHGFATAPAGAVGGVVVWRPPVGGLGSVFPLPLGEGWGEGIAWRGPPGLFHR